jgi:hypothetical protein
MKIVKDLIYKDIVPKDMVSKDKDLKDKPTVFLMSIVMSGNTRVLNALKHLFL